MGWLLPIIGIVVGAALLVVLAWKPLRSLAREAQVKHARLLFVRQREHLEASFLRAATASGKPRGLRWTECEWEQRFELAREPGSGRLAALIGVTIAFEAIPGSDMEGLAAVGNLRNASAVFFFDRGQWRTVGKTVFNMNPDEAIAHFQYARIEAT